MKPAGFCPAGMLAPRGLAYSRLKFIVPHRRILCRVACIAFAALNPRPCYCYLSAGNGGHLKKFEEKEKKRKRAGLQGF